jgi:hypothetical protein
VRLWCCCGSRRKERSDNQRAHPDVVAAYAELKLRLAQQFATVFPAYHAGKHTFIKQVAQAAFADAQELPYGCNS